MMKNWIKSTTFSDQGQRDLSSSEQPYIGKELPVLSKAAFSKNKRGISISFRINTASLGTVNVECKKWRK